MIKSLDNAYNSPKCCFNTVDVWNDGYLKFLIPSFSSLVSCIVGKETCLLRGSQHDWWYCHLILRCIATLWFSSACQYDLLQFPWVTAVRKKANSLMMPNESVVVGHDLKICTATGTDLKAVTARHLVIVGSVMKGCLLKKASPSVYVLFLTKKQNTLWSSWCVLRTRCEFLFIQWHCSVH